MFNDEKRVCDHPINVNCDGASLGQGVENQDSNEVPEFQPVVADDETEDYIVVDNPIHTPPPPRPLPGISENDFYTRDMLCPRVCSGDGVTGDSGYGNVTSDKIITGEVTGEGMVTGEAFLTGEIEKKTCFTQRIILQKMIFCEPYMLEHI